MKKYILLVLLCIVALGASAQSVSRNYQRASMSQVLKDLSKAGDQ